MGYGDHCISSPRYCFSTQDCNEWMIKQYPNNDDDDRKIIPKWFYLNLPYCDECEKYIELIDNKCSNHQSHRLLITCNYCRKHFKTFNSRQVRCPSCCRSIERNLKKHFREIKKVS